MDDQFWDFYWETRLKYLQGQGKGEVILQSSRLMRQSDAPMRILEAGCGEAQIIGSLVEAHGSPGSAQPSVGIDRDPVTLAVARKQYPTIHFMEGDFTNPVLLQTLGTFDLLLLVNALHHVFSDAFDESRGEINVLKGKADVRTAFATLVQTVKRGGYLVIFDGLEAPGAPDTPINIRFHNPEAQEKFQIFANEYKPFRIQFQQDAGSNTVTLRLRDFTRYVTKIIFLGKPLWSRERLESYQYFQQSEMLQMLSDNNFKVLEMRFLSVDYDRWENEVEILTPGVEFPPEHVIITSQKK